MNDADAAPRSPKFRHTREVVRIALDDGMTQEAVARLCRTQQSVVSAWASGKSRAREEVIRPLVNRYGHKLNRATSRLYLVQGEPDPAWSDTPTGRLVRRLNEDAKAYTREHLNDAEWQAMIRSAVKRKVKGAFLTEVGGKSVVSPAAPRGDDGKLLEEALVGVNKAELAAAEASFDYHRSEPVQRAWDAIAREAGLPERRAWQNPDALIEAAYQERFLRLVRVEGAPIWRHVLGRPKMVLRREGRQGERKEAVMEPIARWAVHPTGQDKFRLVVQEIRRLVGPDAVAWARATNSSGSSIGSLMQGDGNADDGRVRSDDDVARWVGCVLGPFDLPTLLAEIETRLRTAGPHDRAVVPFTLRKALVERGTEVPGIEFLPL